MAAHRPVAAVQSHARSSARSAVAARGSLRRTTCRSRGTQTGDDPRWSRPDFDDSAWPRVAVRSTWREQGHTATTAMVWFRRAETLDDEARLAARKDGSASFSVRPRSAATRPTRAAVSIGRSARLALALPFGSREVFRVPREAIGNDGTVSLALRVRRIGWASDRGPAEPLR